MSSRSADSNFEESTMFGGNTYLMRPARDADEPALRRLAFLDSAEPLSGRILIGEIDGVPAAAISIDERRTVADPFQRSESLRIHLRLRAGAIEACEHEPSLAERIRAAMRGEPIARRVLA
jgi:hypothetical protein